MHTLSQSNIPSIQHASSKALPEVQLRVQVPEFIPQSIKERHPHPIHYLQVHVVQTRVNYGCNASGHTCAQIGNNHFTQVTVYTNHRLSKWSASDSLNPSFSSHRLSSRPFLSGPWASFLRPVDSHRTQLFIVRMRWICAGPQYSTNNYC